eukprot:Rmarinus@m.7664
MLMLSRLKALPLTRLLNSTAMAMVLSTSSRAARVTSIRIRRKAMRSLPATTPGRCLVARAISLTAGESPFACGWMLVIPRRSSMPVTRSSFLRRSPSRSLLVQTLAVPVRTTAPTRPTALCARTTPVTTAHPTRTVPRDPTASLGRPMRKASTCAPGTRPWTALQTAPSRASATKAMTATALSATSWLSPETCMPCTSLPGQPWGSRRRCPGIRAAKTRQMTFLMAGSSTRALFLLPLVLFVEVTVLTKLGARRKVAAGPIKAQLAASRRMPSGTSRPLSAGHTCPRRLRRSPSCWTRKRMTTTLWMPSCTMTATATATTISLKDVRVLSPPTITRDMRNLPALLLLSSAAIAVTGLRMASLP